MVSSGITAEAYLCTKEKRSSLGLLSPLKTAVAAAGTAGTAACFMSCYDTGVSIWTAVLCAVISCVIFGTVFCLKKRFVLPCVLTLAAVYTGTVFFLRERFCAGLANIVNIYLAAIHESYRSKPFISIISPDSVQGDTTVFIVLTVIFIGMVYCWGMIFHSSLPAVMSVSLLPLELCLYFGFAPDYIAFFAVAASWFAVFAGELSISENLKINSSQRRASGQAVFSAAAVVMICAMCVTGIVKLSGYERPENIKKVYDDIVDYIRSGELEESISEIRLNEIIKRESTINHGRLGENGNITFSGDTILEVTMPKAAETIYLRGFIGSVYTGNSWQELPEESLKALERINGGFRTEGLNTMLLGSYNLKMANGSLDESSFTVKNISSGNDYYYVPYNLVPESIRHYAVKNDTVVSGGADTWFGRFYSDPTSVYGYRMLLTSPWTVPNLTLAQDISSYRNFVYSDNYLAVPDGFMGADEVFDERYYAYITEENGTEGKSTLSESVVFGRKLYYIRNWLRENCEYSLSVGRLPSGKDFADHFITDTRAGSCTHFATAAALLCRYAGIPSRYVEGYVIKPADFDEGASFGSSCTVNVTDARAHAWVEIYVDGFGWYPMEFTSGYGNIMTAVTTAPVHSETELSSETASETEESGSVTTAAEATEQSQETAQTTITAHEETEAQTQQSVTEKPSPDGDTGYSVFGGSDNGRSYKQVYDLTVPLVTGLIICIVVAIFGIRRWVIVKKCNEISLRKNAPQLQYRRFLKLVKAAGLPLKGNDTYSEYAEKLSRSPVIGSNAHTVISLALKAEFGGGELSREEYSSMRRAVDQTAENYLGGLNRGKKFLAEYLLGIV